MCWFVHGALGTQQVRSALPGLTDGHMTRQFRSQGDEGFDGGHRGAVGCTQSNLNNQRPFLGAGGVCPARSSEGCRWLDSKPTLTTSKDT